MTQKEHTLMLVVFALYESKEGILLLQGLGRGNWGNEGESMAPLWWGGKCRQACPNRPEPGSCRSVGSVTSWLLIIITLRLNSSWHALRACRAIRPMLAYHL